MTNFDLLVYPLFLNHLRLIALYLKIHLVVEKQSYYPFLGDGYSE